MFVWVIKPFVLSGTHFVLALKPSVSVISLGLTRSYYHLFVVHSPINLRLCKSQMWRSSQLVTEKVFVWDILRSALLYALQSTCLSMVWAEVT